MQIWQVKTGDGVTRFFESRTEADFYAKDAGKAGFWTRTSPIPLPKDPKAFVDFMERYFAAHRKLILSAHELTEKES